MIRPVNLDKVYYKHKNRVFSITPFYTYWNKENIKEYEKFLEREGKIIEEHERMEEEAFSHLSDED